MTDRPLAVSVLCGLCLLLLPRLGHTAQATMTVSPFDALTRVAGVTWDDADTVLLSGLPVSVRPFQANDTVSSLAQRFMRAQPQLRRMLVAGGGLLLSGMVGPHHLVIQLQVAGTGAGGFATILDTSLPPRHDNAATGNELNGLLSGAIRVFAAQQTTIDVTVRQTIHWMDTPFATMAPHLDNRLQRLGWQPWRQPSLPGDHAAWQLQGDVLMLLPDPVTQGSLVYQLRHQYRGQP